MQKLRDKYAGGFETSNLITTMRRFMHDCLNRP